MTKRGVWYDWRKNIKRWCGEEKDVSLFIALILLANVFRYRFVCSIAEVIDFGWPRRIVVSTSSETASRGRLLISVAGRWSRIVVDVRRLLGRSKRAIVHLWCVGRSL